MPLGRLLDVERHPLAGAQEAEHARVHGLGVDLVGRLAVVGDQNAGPGDRVVGLHGRLWHARSLLAYCLVLGHSGPLTAQKDSAPKAARSEQVPALGAAHMAVEAGLQGLHRIGRREDDPQRGRASPGSCPSGGCRGTAPPSSPGSSTSRRVARRGPRSRSRRRGRRARTSRGAHTGNAAHSAASERSNNIAPNVTTMIVPGSAKIANDNRIEPTTAARDTGSVE